MINPNVRRFLNLLCGEYSNQQQAFDNPPFYAHIFLRYRPLPQLTPGSILLEQTYAVAPDTPYRLRMIRAEEQPSGAIKLWNHTFRDPSRFAGATFHPDLRQSIQATDLINLEQCHYQVLEQEDGYHGAMEPGCQCIVRRNGKDTVLVSSFHLQGESLQTLDRGHDPITNERCWGSVAGPFRFQRTQSWSADLASAWM
ncbi:putative phycobilin:phycocyanin lyase [Synechococcus sp. MEDNS5]|uniref:chromophore lyase CpcT/CpeT n=1 Tax=Synechococcus sp. MEDNS5 TaxID=1442554 RepID=UPI001644149E|nr:chromophore lyase CpcT/CpeT [Synechococcus sp. MEDNS5]QNJ05239.1 putative phycobilin:phycocyanin lyase [Synechococcus sp. MEDNS5]